MEEYKVTKHEDGSETREKVNNGFDFKRFMEVFNKFKMKPYNPSFTKLFLNNTLNVEHISKFLDKPLDEQKKFAKIYNKFEKILADYEAYKSTCKGDNEYNLFDYCYYTFLLP